MFCFVTIVSCPLVVKHSTWPQEWRERDKASPRSISGILMNAASEQGGQTRTVKDDTNESHPAV